jgi:hypothetical protein
VDAETRLGDVNVPVLAFTNDRDARAVSSLPAPLIEALSRTVPLP